MSIRTMSVHRRILNFFFFFSVSIAIVCVNALATSTVYLFHHSWAKIITDKIAFSCPAVTMEVLMHKLKLWTRVLTHRMIGSYKLWNHLTQYFLIIHDPTNLYYWSILWRINVYIFYRKSLYHSLVAQTMLLNSSIHMANKTLSCTNCCRVFNRVIIPRRWCSNASFALL